MGFVFDRVRRLRARLAGATSAPWLGLPCSVCGEPATGWVFHADDRDGTQVIEGYAACAAHQAAEGFRSTKAG